MTRLARSDQGSIIYSRRPMADRWATFDCYGTLIDWEGGIAAALRGLWPDTDRERLLADYHAVESRVQAERDLSYREVMRRAANAVGAIEGLAVPPGREDVLADSLPDWSPFAEVPAALAKLRDRGWRLAILSNTDPDLLAASVAALGVTFDLLITAAEAGSYKPALGHWERFRAELGTEPAVHVHVAASLFHDIEPCSQLDVDCVWINRRDETSDLPRAAELPDLAALPEALERFG
jgi:2-haloacid dehalogenase